MDASFGYRLAIVWLLSGPEREETMGTRLPNGMPNEQWGRGGIELKGRWGLALCPAQFSRFEVVFEIWLKLRVENCEKVPVRNF